jgi:hypothetical protein
LLILVEIATAFSPALGLFSLRETI